MNEDTNSNTTSTEPSDIKSQVLAFRDNAHAANVKKLKAGIKCIFTVPACFLILLFLTGSSKIIFLVLWIASLFIIAAYLIHVEYSDYKVQEMVNSLQIRKIILTVSSTSTAYIQKSLHRRRSWTT